MGQFRSFLKESTNNVEDYLTEFGNAVVKTHQRVKIGGKDFFVPYRFKPNCPNKMISACWQGDEPAGWLGLLEYVKKFNPENANVTYMPVASKEVFESGEHEDNRGENPNHNIPNNPSHETRMLLQSIRRWLPYAAHGFLDLHEDPWRSEGYIFLWSDCKGLGSRLVHLLSKNFPLHKGGVIIQDDQGMMGDYLSKLGVQPCVTTETPVKGFDLQHRVTVNVQMIMEFLRC